MWQGISSPSPFSFLIILAQLLWLPYFGPSCIQLQAAAFHPDKLLSSGSGSLTRPRTRQENQLAAVGPGKQVWQNLLMRCVGLHCPVGGKVRINKFNFLIFEISPLELLCLVPNSAKLFHFPEPPFGLWCSRLVQSMA